MTSHNKHKKKHGKSSREEEHVNPHLLSSQSKEKTPEMDRTDEIVEAYFARKQASVHPTPSEGSPPRLAGDIGYVRKHGGLPATKKSLGQNWLQDQEALDSIVSSLNLTASDTVLEVGPGPGPLTEKLLLSGASVRAVEIDRRMVDLLQSKWKDHPEFDLHFKDILQTDFTDIVGEQEFKLTGNLPYHITSSLLFNIMDFAREKPGKLKRIVILLQKEVAERIISEPGDSEYSILSVFLRFWGKPELVTTVSRDQFIPPPKVDAGIIAMDIAPEPLYPIPHWPTLKRLVKGAFSKRRKMLRNSLPGIAQIGPWESVKFDWTRRPQTLSAEEYAQLASQLIPRSARKNGSES